MSLYENWLTMAYDKEGKSKKVLWDDYIPREQKIYEYLLENKQNQLSGTVVQIANKFEVPVEYICGFLDGIQDVNQTPPDMETLTDEEEVNVCFAFDALYKKMVEYRAEHLVQLPQWDNIYDEETRKQMYQEQKKSGTFIREEKVGRNDLCPCGSGKKYKKCCGAN